MDVSSSPAQPSSEFSQLREKVEFWRHHSELEVGRNLVLKMAARGRPIQETLVRLCIEARNYNPRMFCSVLRFDEQAGTLHPIASDGLPDFYNDALEGVKVGQGVGSCGTAAFSKKRTIVEDISSHPYWVQYKDLALSAGLQACWSEPIMGENGRCFGTFAMYYANPCKPTTTDLNFIEVSANLAAVVFENHENREQLLKANQELSQTLDERSQKLSNTISALEKLLSDQGQAHDENLTKVKSETTKSLVVGVAHEFNTPVGIAVTSISSALDQVTKIQRAMEAQTALSRTAMLDALQKVVTTLRLGDNNLVKASELISKFKSINVEEFDSAKSHFNLKAFFVELQGLLSGMLKGHTLTLEVTSVDVYLAKQGLTQLLLQLVENTLVHGFEGKDNGTITLNVDVKNGRLIINYQDNGCGIPAKLENRVFEPFFVGKAESDNMGLGLNIVSNIVTNLYQGTFRSLKAPLGARFEIDIPLTLPPVMSLQG